MAKASSQKFIARNRSPRVQIEYDVETYGSMKRIELPFVMGVLADLSGNNAGSEKADMADRGFLDIDMDNFDARMKSINPGVTFKAENKLGEGGLFAIAEKGHQPFVGWGRGAQRLTQTT
mgnify:CR=1 FL=1